MKVSGNFRMTMILCLVHLIVGTPQMNQKPQELKEADRKERQLGLLALGLGELFGSIFAGSAAAAAGTAAVAGAGLLGAAAIKDAVDHHHSGSSGSSGGSSGGSQTTSVADQTISRVQAMSKAQVETEIRTLVTTAGAPRPSNGDMCMGSTLGYFGGNIHLGVCLPSCPTSELSFCNIGSISASTCLTGKCCVKDRIVGGHCVGYSDDRNVTTVVGACKATCSSHEAAAKVVLCKSCKNTKLTKKCCFPNTPAVATLMG